MRILVLCTGNSARSQMGEGWFHYLAPHLQVESAGFKPKGMNPLAVEAMREVGVDISGQTSKAMSDLPSLEFDFVITVCATAETACPAFPGKTKRLFWPHVDPANLKILEEERLGVFRQVRDQLQDRIRAFVAELEV